MNLLEHIRCSYCGLELEPCRLPFCSLDHAVWHVWGKPPLAKDQMENLYEGKMREVRYKFWGMSRWKLEREMLPQAAGNDSPIDAPGMELYRR